MGVSRWKRWAILTAGIVGSAAITASTVVAQQQHAAASVPTRAVYAERISIHLDTMLLADALFAIAHRAKLMPLFEDAALPRGKRVALHAENAPVAEAFRLALKGTGFVAHIRPEGQVLIVPDQTAQDTTGIIVGRVVNGKTQQPIAGARVTVGRSQEGATTDVSGEFRLVAPAGSQDIIVRAVGFVRHTHTVTVSASQTVTVDLALEHSTNVLQEVVVTGTVIETERRAIATPITVITADDIEKRGITRIEQLFRGEVPGVVALELGTARYSVGDDGGNSSQTLGSMVRTPLYSRGSPDGGTNPIKTYVDGVEIVDPSYLGTIDPQTIERIEVVTGPQAATIYGSGAMGGVMQIFTKRGANTPIPEVSLRIRYGILENNMSNGKTPSHNDVLSVTGGAGSAFSYAATATYSYTGKWQPGLFSRMMGASIGGTQRTGPVVVSANYATTINTNGTYGSGRYCDGRSDGSGCVSGLQEKELFESGKWAPSPYYSLNLRNSTRISRAVSQTVSLNADYSVSAWWQHHLTVGRNFTSFHLKPVMPSYREWPDTLYRTSRSGRDRTTASYNTTVLSPTWGAASGNLIIGANGSWDGGGSQVNGCVATMDATTVMDCYNERVSVAEPLLSRNYGGFASLRVGMFDRLYLTLGLRADKNPHYGSEHKINWTPTNGLTYVMDYGNLTLKFLASYGKATRAPAPSYREAVLRILSGVWERGGQDIYSYYARIESPHLRPEVSSGPQGGIELYYGNIGSLTINRYHQTIDDMIAIVNVDSFVALNKETLRESMFRISQYQNMSKTISAGWEGTGMLILGPVSAKASYSWNDTRVVRHRFQPEGHRFGNAPTHIGNVSLSYARSGTSLTLTNNFVGQSIVSERLGSMWREVVRLGMYMDHFVSESRQVAKPGYTKSDLVVSHRLSDRITGTLNIMNLGNGYGSDLSRLVPTLGRQTQVGVVVKLP